MIENSGKYYLYRHIRIDNGQPFYIGIGSKIYKQNKSFSTLKSEYSRAYTKYGRNIYWKRIINKTKYYVEIMIESNDYSFIKKKEIEFIYLYRKNQKLSNLTDGGEGGNGYKPTPETLSLMKLNNGMKGKFGSLNHLSSEVYVYTIDGSFYKKYGSQRECSRELNLDRKNINLCIKGEVKKAFGYTFKNKFQGLKIKPIKVTRSKAVKALDKNLNTIKEFSSVTEAANFAKTQTTNISKACKNKKSLIKGYYWRYLKSEN